MPKKKTTIEDLAIMVQQGFEGVQEQFDNVNSEFENVRQEFKKVNDRLDRIENILIAGHDRRIEKLEDTVRQLMTAIKLK